jgi:phage terminase small subunit
VATDYTDSGIDPESGLTLKQRLFCDVYLTCLNATKAYREAGYAADSHGTARTESSKLLTRPDVQGWLGERMKERADRLNVSAERTLTELVVVGYSNIAHYRVNPETGAVEVLPGVPEEALRAVRSVKATRRVVNVERNGQPATETVCAVEIQLWDKLRALETLSKHLGLVSPELPPLEVLLNRLPPAVSNLLRQMLATRPDQRPPRPPGAGDGGLPIVGPPLPPAG